MRGWHTQAEAESEAKRVVVANGEEVKQREDKWYEEVESTTVDAHVSNTKAWEITVHPLCLLDLSVPC